MHIILRGYKVGYSLCFSNECDSNGKPIHFGNWKKIAYDTGTRLNLTRLRLKNWHRTLAGRSGIESCGSGIKHSILSKPLPPSNSSVQKRSADNKCKNTPFQVTSTVFLFYFRTHNPDIYLQRLWCVMIVCGPVMQ